MKVIPKHYTSKKGSVKSFSLIERLIFICFFCAALGLQAQQCTLPSRIYLPAADETRIELLGRAVAVDGEYMVAGLQENSSLQVYAGIAYVYKLDTDNKWVKIAELTPSDPAKYATFGNSVSISDNSIVISAREYNDAGISRGKLYVYEKSDGEEWASTTEDYIIAKDFGSPLVQNGFGQFVVQGDELIAIASDNGKLQIEIYKKTGGIFLLSQAIDTPQSYSGYSNFIWNLAVANGFIVLGSEQFEHADRSNGAAFVYEKNGNYSTTPVLLRSTQQSASLWAAFGICIAASNNTVVVQGLKYDGSKYDQTFYVFEKPPTGWAPMTQPAMLEAPGYVASYSQLVANDNYFFSTGEDYRSIVGFKKPAGGWSSTATSIILNDIPADKSVVGWQIALNDNHLVVGCPSRFLFHEIGEELIADYYSNTGAWETPGLAYHQLIREKSILATDDFFGQAFGVYGNQLAVSATGDDERSIDGGVVYVFNVLEQSAVPDQKIFNPEDENYTGFGNSIAMGDSLMFIGAPFKDSVGIDGKAVYYNIGKVYIYRLDATGWRYASQIIAPTIHSEVTFGQQIAWSRGYCAVTEFYGGNSEMVGRVHIYKENEESGKFEYIATLDPATHLRSDFFGQSMVMTDSMMVIGMGNFAPNSSYRMSVYIFKKKGEWKNATEDARLTATDIGWSDRFGASVSMYGDYIVVGAPTSPGFDPRPIPRNYIIPGAAYVYKRPKGGWAGTLTEFAKLSPSDPTEMGAYGASVMIDHNDIFIGSPNVYRQYNYTDKFTNNDNTLIPGKVYHYKKPAGGWVTTNQETRQLHSFEPEIVDGYGASLYVSDRFLYVSAPLDDTPAGFRTGSVQTMMQLPAIDAPEVLCIDQAPSRLLGFPKNGQWSGPGVNAIGTFSPAVAGPGIHTITYSYGGCETTTSIEVLPSRMIVHHQSDLLQTKCIGKSASVAFESNEDPRNYMWFFKETLNETYHKFDSSKQVIAAGKPGYYQVIVDRGFCPERSQEFQVMDENEVAINITPVPTVCEDTEIQLSYSPTSGQWNGPGISPDGKFSPINLTDGNYKEIYKVVTAGGCVWMDSILVEVDILKFPAIQYDGRPICGDSTVVLTLTNVDDRSTIEWYNGGKLLQGWNGPSIHAFEGGGYTAEVSKGTCKLQTAIQVVLKEVIDIQFDVPVICSDQHITLKVTPENGTWQGPGVSAQGQFDPSDLPEGTYPELYTLVTPIGCTWQKSIAVKVDRLKEPVIATDLEEVCINRPATLKLDNVDARTNITWHDMNGDEVSGQNGLSFMVGEAGTYFATVSKSYCSFRTDPVQLTAIPESMFVPNVFTANNDTVNDYFQIQSEGIDDFELLLFNRFGQSMFETKDQNFKWAAENIPSGIYFWKISYITCSNGRRQEKGWVHIIK